MSEDLIQILTSIDTKLDTLYELVGHQTAIEYIILVIIVAYLLSKLYYYVLALFDAY